MSLRLEESLHSKEETSRNLVEIVARSQIHEQDLAKLQLEVNALTQSEAESRVECEKLRQQEAKTIENTELYKTQYEDLLHEYNQYLEDLEAVQTKLKGLESLKTTYEEENSSLRALCERYQSKADEMQARVEEVEVIF